MFLKKQENKNNKNKYKLGMLVILRISKITKSFQEMDIKD